MPTFPFHTTQAVADQIKTLLYATTPPNKRAHDHAFTALLDFETAPFHYAIFQTCSANSPFVLVEDTLVYDMADGVNLYAAWIAFNNQYQSLLKPNRPVIDWGS